REIRLPSVLTELANARDVRVPEAGGRARPGEESGPLRGCGQVAADHHLQGEARVAPGPTRAVDDARAATAELRPEHVVAEADLRRSGCRGAHVTLEGDWWRARGRRPAGAVC